MSIEIIPDRSCQHVEAGAERVGGMHFPENNPPVSIGMCQECLDWAVDNESRVAPLNDDAVEMLDGKTLDEEFVDDELPRL